MKAILKKNLTSCDVKELQHYPIIFGVGDDNRNLHEYVVAIRDVFYTFPNFIEAMDAAFKCFVVYNIPFPPQVVKYWMIINGIFYKIDHVQLKLTPSVSALLKSFD